MPRRKKKDPPRGFTGGEGRWPTELDVLHWRRERADANVALRLPEHVLGIDLDAYKVSDALDHLLALTGPLPLDTWRSSARRPPSGSLTHHPPLSTSAAGRTTRPR